MSPEGTYICQQKLVVFRYDSMVVSGKLKLKPLISLGIYYCIITGELDFFSVKDGQWQLIVRAISFC